MKMTIAAVLAVTALGALAACSTVDRPAMSSLQPLPAEAGAQMYTFIAKTDAYHRPDDTKSEQTRMEWLRKWLDDNGHQGKPFEIVSRSPIKSGQGLLGDAFTIYYKIGVPMSTIAQ